MSKLTNVLEDTDSTDKLVQVLKDVMAPPAVEPVNKMDPELKEWMQLRPNLGADHRAQLDGLAGNVLQALSARLGGGAAAPPLVRSGNFNKSVNRPVKTSGSNPARITSEEKPPHYL